MKEVMPFGTTWVNLEGATVSETIQTQKDKYCRVSYTEFEKQNPMWSSLAANSCRLALTPHFLVEEKTAPIMRKLHWM